MPIYTIEINEKQHLKYPLAITISYAVTTLHVSLLLSATQCIILLLNGKYLPTLKRLCISNRTGIYSSWCCKLFAIQTLSQTQKNVSEPQTGSKPVTFWPPVRCSNHWATRTLMVERRYIQCVLVRMCNIHVHILLIQQPWYVCISFIYNRYIWNVLQLGNLKVNCLLLKLYCKLGKILLSPRQESSIRNLLISGETL